MAEAHPPANARRAATVAGEDAFGHRRLKRVNLALLLAVPLAMLFVRGVADALFVLIGLSFLYVSARSGRWEWLRETPIVLALTLWVFLNLVVSPFAVDPAVSFGRSLPWIRFVAFYAAVTAWLLTDERDLRLMAWWMAGVLALVIADVLTQALTGVTLTGNPIFGNRLTGPLDRPNIGMLLAKFGFPTLGLIVLLCRRTEARWVVFATAGLCVSMLVAILLTGERNATTLTLLSILLPMGLLYIAYPRWRLAAAGALAVTAGAVIIVVNLEARISGRLAQLVNDLSQYSKTIYGELLAVSLRIFADHPLTGAGLKNFRIVCPTYEDAGVISGCHPHSHNIYLEWLSEAGGIGLLLFTIFVVSLFAALIRSARAQGVDGLSMGFLLGALLLSLFPLSVTQSFFSNWPAMLMWFSIALAMAVARGPWCGPWRGPPMAPPR